MDDPVVDLARRLKPSSVTTPKAETRWDARRDFRGLWAREACAPGEIVWVSYLHPWNCEFFTWADLQHRPELMKYSYQIGPDEFSHSKVVEDDSSNFFNHSCDANTWYDDSRALRLRYFFDYVMPSWIEASPSLRNVSGEVRRYFEAAWDGGRAVSPPHPSLPEAQCMVERMLLDARDIEFIVARRTIPADEEITMDYCTFWTACDLEFECRCGAPRCRRILRASDWRLLPPDHCALYVREMAARERVESARVRISSTARRR